ncbi:SIMPL domain-containing protein [Patescibacteria group bacterium]|nr:SIMPL domain-containing protein [Patescibacteria group bacterium]MBU1755186.1 SIMPL domain-containing protein [Patescibacteria group bacterium]
MNNIVNEISSNKGIRIASVTVLGLLALFLLAITIDTVKGFDENAVYPAKTITVVGTGEATVVPDIARVTFTVQETADDVASAQSAATNRTNDALNAVGEMGVEEKDFKTLSYNVYPQYEQINCANGNLPTKRSSYRWIPGNADRTGKDPRYSKGW